MKALLHEGDGLNGVRYGEIDRPPLGPREVVIKIKAAALNHRDLSVTRLREPTLPAVVLGSDGAGVIAEVGAAVDDLAPGAEVVVNASLDWDNRTHVPLGEYHTDYKILGYPHHGTFAETLVIGRHQVEPKPAFLSWQEAAAFPLVGLTTYRALFTEGRLTAGQVVLIPGIGGGAASQALLFAKAAGARVVVTSRDAGKCDAARALGADLALPSDAEWSAAVREISGGRGADIVIETVGAPTFDKSMAALANGGCLVVFGVAGGADVTVDLRSLFLHWQSIIGTTMGSRDEFRAMLAFVEAHRIRPVIDRTFPLAEGVDAMRYLASGAQMGNIVLEVDP